MTGKWGRPSLAVFMDVDSLRDKRLARMMLFMDMDSLREK